MTVYERNLEILPKHHEELVNLVQESWPSTHLSIELAKTGEPRLRVMTESGSIVDLHDPDDPAKVAQGTIQQMGPDLEGVTVVLGIELGYLARAAVPRLSGKTRLVIYEADPAIWLMALQTVDLSEVLGCPWVKILVGPQAPLRHWATQIISQTNGTLRVVCYDPVFQLAPDIYGARVERELDRIPGIVKATKNAVIRRGPMFIESVLKNVPHIMMAGAAASLKGVGSGLPAIIVAAGPSLEKNVHHLKAVKGRAVLIAADTALSYLLPRGIVPDLVVSVDPQPETYKKFQHLEIPGEVALVYHPAVSPLIVKHFPGPTFTMDTSMPVYQWLKPNWVDKGALDSEAMCQAHVAFNLAEWMGCEAIAFVGQDLSYNEARMHVKHGGYMTDAEQAMMAKGGLMTKDIFGKPVKTNPTFVNYKAVFERKIRSFAGKVVQATEGGLALEGAETCLLADVVNEWCQGPTVEIEAQLGGRQHTPTLEDVECTLEEVKNRTRDLFRVERTSRHVCRLLETMKKRWEEHRQVDQEFTRLGKQVEQLTAFIPGYRAIRELLHWMELELEIQLSQDTQELESTTDILRKHEIQLERGLRYYGGLIRVAPKLRNYCERLAGTMEQWRSLLGLEHLGGTPPSWLELGERYVKLELYSRAEDCLRRHVECKEDDAIGIPEAILSIRIPLMQQQFTEALTHADAARVRYPDNPEIKTLWNQAKLAYGQWHDHKGAVEGQGIAPLDSHVKAGDFYHRTGNFARAKVHYRLALGEEGRAPDEAWDFFDDIRDPKNPDSTQEGQVQLQEKS